MTDVFVPQPQSAQNHRAEVAGANGDVERDSEPTGEVPVVEAPRAAPELIGGSPPGAGDPRSQGRLRVVRRPLGAGGRVPDDAGRPGHRPDRTIGVREVHLLALAQPDARARARIGDGRRDSPRRRRHLRSLHTRPGHPDTDRHGLPEAQPLPGHERAGKRAGRPEAHQDPLQRPRRIGRTVASAGRPLARGARSTRVPGGALSGGQQQRLCIARSLAVAPNVLLMDEPCSALDPTSTRRIEETITELREDVTVVIVTHNMQQAQRVSDHCAFFLAAENEPGRLVEQGTTENDVQFSRGPTDPRLRQRQVRVTAPVRACGPAIPTLRRLAGGRAGLMVDAGAPAGAANAPANGQGSTYAALAFQQWTQTVQNQGLNLNYTATSSPAGLEVVQPEHGRLRRNRGRVLRAASRITRQRPTRVRVHARRRRGDRHHVQRLAVRERAGPRHRAAPGAR